MMSYLRFFLFALIFGTCSVATKAQSEELKSSTFDILMNNPSVVSAGMGNLSMIRKSDMPIYSIPISRGQNIHRRFHINAMSDLSTFVKSKISRSFYALSGDYKLKNHTFYLGARRRTFSSLIQTFDPVLKYEKMNSSCFTVDAGYSYLLTQNWSVYCKGSFLNEAIGYFLNTIGSKEPKTTSYSAVTASLGAVYTHRFSKKYDWTSSFSVLNMGRAYGYKNLHTLPWIPTCLNLSSLFMIPVLRTSHVSAGAGVSYYIAQHYNRYVRVNVGAEYDYNNFLSFRIGDEFDRNVNFFTVGAGCNYKIFSVNISLSKSRYDAFYKIGLGVYL